MITSKKWDGAHIRHSGLGAGHRKRPIRVRGASLGSRILLSLTFWLSEAADPCEGCVLGFANPALPSVLAIGSGRSVPGVRPWVCESHYPLRSGDRKRPIRVRGASLGSRPALALATLSWLRVKSTVGTRGFSYKCSGIAKHCTHEGSSTHFDMDGTADLKLLES